MLKVEVIGNLGADCEVKDVNGNKFGACRVANSQRYTDAQGKEHDDTTWVDVIIPDADNKVIPFLKSGTKVFVRGNARLRVYSSPKDKMMKAGLTIQAWEIELCGGSTDAVPRQLIVPETGLHVEVSKLYHAKIDTSALKKNDVAQLIDKRGATYWVNKLGLVVPADAAGESDGSDSSENAQ